MSNPGVLTLTLKEISPTKTFRVEDNLAESIHFHYNDIRIDLSIAELLYIAEVSDEAIQDLVQVEGLNLDEYDQDFLNSYSQVLMDLSEIKRDVIKVGDVYYNGKNIVGLPVRKHLKAENRIKKDTEVEVPIFFNDDNTVIWGKEEIAKQLSENSSGEIEIIRWYFEKGKHTPSKHPWFDYLFKWDKKRIIKTAKKLAMKVLG